MDESYAAVDLGSNSFHMIVANLVDGRLQIIDRMKEMVRLAAGLNNKQELSKESMQQALECLQRFGQRIRGNSARECSCCGNQYTASSTE